MNMTLLYLSDLFTSAIVVYSLPVSKPNIFLISAISLFSDTFFCNSPLTFITLPFKGYTPIVFLSSDDNPEMTPVLAESPSQKIRTQSEDFSVPAQLASVSFGIPLIDLDLVPSVFFAALFSLTSVNCSAASITPIFATFSINLSLTSHFEPNLADGVFIKSLV